MNTEETQINLDELAGGAVHEKFNREMKRVLANIMDPNTDPEKKRKITITLTIAGDENRMTTDVTVSAKSTLAPSKDVSTKLVIGEDHYGNVLGQELKSGIIGQTYMDDDGELRDDTGHLIDLQKKRNESK
ncbi:replication terminator protein [Terribacillus sp. AE2B 122]|uniref:replication terminator protein n=1 Tax=Terribacillus sp. AE2B 122 TaxID=1331902 RepID=UPI0020C5C94C|nr:replication terminator protein [Terribacillus sp. AE2B 122]